MTRWILAATLLLVTVFAHAQAPSMEPPAELKKLDWMIGEWSGNVKMSMEGMDMEGVMTYSLSWSGQFIKGISVWDVQGMKMTEDMYMGWDPQKGKYSSYTFTNFAPTPRIEWGESKGDTTVWMSEPWITSPGQPATLSRVTLTKVSGSEMKFLLEFKAGDQWQKIGDAVFKKK